MTGRRFLEYIDPKERNVWCKPSDMNFHILIMKTLKKKNEITMESLTIYIIVNFCLSKRSELTLRIFWLPLQ